ncbi:MAG: hypothetical protein UT34_C0002G0203 [candidate division WS6 bacterium GW2011_GWF2_39_15]|uniref:LiaI-LiaF-like transmembrane region domain-containing protein n=1 Tax=candidate division WS6 bacterium GW2011_GWF2_39_15 TaxID=1619100 RepID=A0A0G0MYS8_9BACT|nr:MAG: hypothetical protein UT34_C0002G0203 [candidate division WS6 bacterium GW2011_GWF2_39_15]
MEKSKTTERISGAIFLIFIGFLFLMINLGYFSFSDLFTFFFAIWPIFIVIIGIKIILSILPFGRWINIVIDVVVDIAIIMALILGYNAKINWKIPDVVVIGNAADQKDINGTLDVKKSEYSEVERVNYVFEIGVAEFSIHESNQDDYLLTTGEYNKRIFSPEVKSEKSGNNLDIEFTQKSTRGTVIHPWRIITDFKFKTASLLPFTYDIKVGAGKGEVDINSDNVEEMKMDVGAGEMVVNINEKVGSDLDLNVGAGKVKIFLPKGSGYIIDYNVGVGDLSVFRNKEKKSVGGLGNKGTIKVNDNAEKLLKMDINIGAGSVEIEER